jgi:hypothetical protein
MIGKKVNQIWGPRALTSGAAMGGSVLVRTDRRGGSQSSSDQSMGQAKAPEATKLPQLFHHFESLIG